MYAWRRGIIKWHEAFHGRNAESRESVLRLSGPHHRLDERMTSTCAFISASNYLAPVLCTQHWEPLVLALPEVFTMYLKPSVIDSLPSLHKYIHGCENSARILNVPFLYSRTTVFRASPADSTSWCATRCAGASTSASSSARRAASRSPRRSSPRPKSASGLSGMPAQVEAFSEWNVETLSRRKFVHNRVGSIWAMEYNGGGKGGGVIAADDKVMQYLQLCLGRISG